MSELLTSPYLLYAVVFLAVLLAVEGAMLYMRDIAGAKKRVNKRMEMLDNGASTDEVLSRLRRETAHDNGGGLRARLLNSIDRQLSQAGVRMSRQRLLLLMGGVTLGLMVLLPLALGIAGHFALGGSLLLIGIVAGFLGIGVPLIYLNVRATKRIKKFEEQFPIALDIFVRGLRAGHPVSSALALLCNEMADPIGSEFGIVIDEVNYGLILRDALENLANRVQTADIRMFVVCVAIQSETGGNLAEILDGLSKVIRERAQMVLKVRALASEGKMTGIMLSVLPVLTFLVTFSSSPEFYLDAVGDPLFMPVALFLLFLYATGVMTIRKLVDLKV